MAGIGQELRRTREQLGLSIEDISSRTMIPKKYLVALEEGNFKVFPGEVYLKGALRQYSAELKLNPKEMLERYYREKEPVFAEKEAKEDAKENIQETIRQKRYPRRRVRIKTGRVILLLILLLIITYTVYTVVNREDGHISAPPQGSGSEDENLPPGGEPEPEPGEPDDTPELPVSPPVVIERDSTSTGIRFLVSNTDLIQAEISFSARCWIRITADGEKIFEGTLTAGEKNITSAWEEIVIRLGYPPAAAINVNGEAVELPDIVSPYTLTIAKK
jgi:cytoskeletal protein RodZ